jgi:hypothetical protein
LIISDNTPRNVSIKQNIPGLFIVTWQPPEGKNLSSFQYQVKYRVYPDIDQQVVTLNSHPKGKTRMNQTQHRKL